MAWYDLVFLFYAGLTECVSFAPSSVFRTKNLRQNISCGSQCLQRRRFRKTRMAQRCRDVVGLPGLYGCEAYLRTNVLIVFCSLGVCVVGGSRPSPFRLARHSSYAAIVQDRKSV